ncbi:holo-ACP synthase [Mesoaciditoga lauensis]|uniref:holo-ACP synthase n=1 Tax=Mesoaciditoga lauensis TaxID=1495039 RepID=UPI00056788E9|nr:holo-ACP synthase [Mesoaciditoga lauensis]
MIVGVGIDIVDISRVTEKLAERILSPKEHEIWTKRKGNEFLAGRFALKEAFFKAVGIGIRKYRLKDISFLPDEFGKPHIEENETVKKIREKHEFEIVHASLSHDKGTAVAVIILERREFK